MGGTTELKADFPNLAETLLPRASFLSGSLGASIASAIHGIYGSCPYFERLNFSGGVARGSNPYLVVAANELLKRVGKRVATPRDVEEIRKFSQLGLAGVYTDLAFVLRRGCESEDSKDIIQQIGQKFGKRFEIPLMIPLAGLSLSVDWKNNGKLRFKLREDAEVIPAPILDQQGNFSSRDIDERTGIPRKLDASGRRRLYAVDPGLQRFCLDEELNLGSLWGILNYTTNRGRIVVVEDNGAGYS